MKSNEFLIERVVNILDAPTKQKYVDQVWAMLQSSYVKAGGFKSAASPEELIAKTGLWKLITRDGVITALGLYKDQNGRKGIASGTDGSRQGLRDYTMIKTEDTYMNRAWGEVSGAAERAMQKAGAKPIPANLAPLLTRKEILDYNPDGYHYTRLISGHPHEKIMYGTVELTPQQARQLASAGIDIHSLPANIKIS